MERGALTGVGDARVGGGLTGLLLGGDDEDRLDVARLGGGAVGGDGGLELLLRQLHALLGGELLLEDEVDQLRGDDVVGAGAQGVGQREAGAREVGIDVAGSQRGRGLGLEASGPEVLELLAVVELAARLMSVPSTVATGLMLLSQKP